MQSDRFCSLILIKFGMHRHILVELPSTKFHEYSLSGFRVLTWEQTLEANRPNFATLRTPEKCLIGYEIVNWIGLVQVGLR
jgi:hypothetical protein